LITNRPALAVEAGDVAERAHHEAAVDEIEIGAAHLFAKLSSQHAGH
jgi:hypothetical protein